MITVYLFLDPSAPFCEPGAPVLDPRAPFCEPGAPFLDPGGPKTRKGNWKEKEKGKGKGNKSNLSWTHSRLSQTELNCPLDLGVFCTCCLDHFKEKGREEKRKEQEKEEEGGQGEEEEEKEEEEKRKNVINFIGRKANQKTS